jgi:CBS domain containing-hemolysin-like protein
LSKDKNKSNKQRSKVTRWILIIILWTFASAAFLSFLSETILRSVNLVLAFVLLIIIIFIHLLFDLIGVAVTACSEVPFIAMASRKIKGASQALNLVKNADRVANICQDVIGDVTGIVSGLIGAAIIAILLLKNPGLKQVLMSIIVTSGIAAVIVAGKAGAKNIAIENCVPIIKKTGLLIYFFTQFFKRKQKQKSNKV